MQIGMELRQNDILGDSIIRSGSTLIMAGTVQYAMIRAHIDNQGRDRRRIKREVNKAAKKARRAMVA